MFTKDSKDSNKIFGGFKHLFSSMISKDSKHGKTQMILNDLFGMDGLQLNTEFEAVYFCLAG